MRRLSTAKCTIELCSSNKLPPLVPLRDLRETNQVKSSELRGEQLRCVERHDVPLRVVSLPLSELFCMR